MFIQRSDSELTLVTSASDLTAASECEFAFLRRVDARLGRDVAVPLDDDPMLARAGALGDEHEQRVLDRYRHEFGVGTAGQPGGVVEIARAAPSRPHELHDALTQTVAALQGGADVVFQATFFDPAQRAADAALGDPAIAYLGYADFLRRTDSGAYEVQDTKLARRAKVSALLQLAAYAEQLNRLGVPVAEEVSLLLGDGARSVHRLDDIAPVFRAQRAHLHRMLLDRAREVGADGRRESAAPIAWGAPGVRACGRCVVCEPEALRNRDPLLIAGIRATQRQALLAAGLHTIDDVAAAVPLDTAWQTGQSAGAVDVRLGERTVRVAGMRRPSLERLIEQARVQTESDGGDIPVFRVIDAAALAAIPEPNPGDLFFDFEGDPLALHVGEGDSPRWGLDYLFGMVDADEVFTPLWAHDLAAERRALERFLALVAERRAAHPGMKIYHYAAYERSHLLSIAARHGVGEAAVDTLLSEHVLVDLYPIVRRALRVGSRSYSIKKLEPLYMGDELRDESGVTTGAQSVTEYAEASEQLRSDDPEVRAEGERRLAAIADYNRYDCVSTLRLRDWLLALAAAHRIEPYPAERIMPLDETPMEVSDAGADLLELADTQADPGTATLLRLAASAIDYHRREQKSFWWAHYARLADPIDEWADTRDVLVVDPESSRVQEDWHTPPRARTLRRHLNLAGEIAPGSSLKEGSEAFAVYDLPAPFSVPGAAPGSRSARAVKILGREGAGVLVEELLPRDVNPYEQLPIALTPGGPPKAGRQKGAIEEWAAGLAAAVRAGREFRDPVADLIRRVPPRLTGHDCLVSPASPAALDAVDGDADAGMIGAVIASLRLLDRSALAIQGPPGTGKTYLAARVIRTLVERDGWHIGVVAQSHKVVENVLEGVISAGLAPTLVGKVPKDGKLSDDAPEPGFTVLPKDGQARFLAEQRAAGRGAVVGGTAWDFSNEDRIGRGALDLLVVDEAGQFSLAPTIAASVAAERLLLLGDPQQLPQVSQGTHPEPVDTSALGWLLGEHGTIPESLGYFLAETRRMHPELADVVSELSYEGRLGAHESASERTVTGGGPAGLIWHPTAHSGNSTYSSEEAALVVQIATRALAASVAVRGEAPRPISVDDVIVVAPYNAQVECIVDALQAAGLGGIRVGTVDRFQGQEAVIAIVSLAASSAEDVPRGLEFLLMRNRLNVAISRAQWAAHLVSSDRLGGGLPASAEGVAALSGYLRLTERAARDAGSFHAAEGSVVE